MRRYFTNTLGHLAAAGFELGISRHAASAGGRLVHLPILIPIR